MEPKQSNIKVKTNQPASAAAVHEDLVETLKQDDFMHSSAQVSPPLPANEDMVVEKSSVTQSTETLPTSAAEAAAAD